MVNNGINSCQDSITVTVLPTSALTIDTAVCDSMFFAGNSLTFSGTYYDTLTNAAGCDSVVTLNLTINTSPTVDLGNDTNLCANASIDLFAGSGSLGIEAISNGADNCIFVEQNQELNFYLKNNCEDLGIMDKTEILRQSAENFVRRVKDKKFDIIFFDPPFKKDYISSLVPQIIDRFSKQGTLVYIENRTSDEKYNFDALELIKETVSGESNGKLFRVSL